MCGCTPAVWGEKVQVVVRSVRRLRWGRLRMAWGATAGPTDGENGPMTRPCRHGVRFGVWAWIHRRTASLRPRWLWFPLALRAVRGMSDAIDWDDGNGSGAGWRSDAN